MFTPTGEAHHGFFQILKCNDGWYRLIRKVVVDKTVFVGNVSE